MGQFARQNEAGKTDGEVRGEIVWQIKFGADLRRLDTQIGIESNKRHILSAVGSNMHHMSRRNSDGPLTAFDICPSCFGMEKIKNS